MSKFKAFAGKVLDGLATVGTAIADQPKYSRIREIDNQVKELLQERDHLIADLIEPGELKVSEDYDPSWRKTETPVSSGTGEGRLTQCKGRFSASSSIHDAHPGCPYLATKHNAHEFTLRD